MSLRGRGKDTVGLSCLSQHSAYKIQAWIKCIWSVRAQASAGSPMSLCSTECLHEVTRFLTFGFSITKYSHHPDGMMNSLNQPQDVIVSTRKALDLCLDWDWDYVRGNWIYAVNKPLSSSFEFGKHLFCYKKGPIDNTLFKVNGSLSVSIMEMYYSIPEITVLATCYSFRLPF